MYVVDDKWLRPIRINMCTSFIDDLLAVKCDMIVKVVVDLDSSHQLVIVTTANKNVYNRVSAHYLSVRCILLWLTKLFWIIYSSTRYIVGNAISKYIVMIIFLEYFMAMQGLMMLSL